MGNRRRVHAGAVEQAHAAPGRYLVPDHGIGQHIVVTFIDGELPGIGLVAIETGMLVACAKGDLPVTVSIAVGNTGVMRLRAVFESIGKAVQEIGIFSCSIIIAIGLLVRIAFGKSWIIIEAEI